MRAEAYGPVVLRRKGGTWRSAKNEGGGALYDYACHAIDLVNFIVGTPTSVGGVVRNSVFSRDVDDEVYSTMHFDGGASGQLCVNWSDESFRKMSTKITSGAPTAASPPTARSASSSCARSTRRLPGTGEGWTVRYTTDLTEEVWFYLRGEEYSAQIDYFAQSVERAPPRRREHLRVGARSRSRRGDDSLGRGGDSLRRPIGRAGPQGRSGRGSAEDEHRVPAMTPTSGHVMDRVLFGDNQFFGVNHMSEEKARAQSMRFQDLEAIIDVLDAAYEEGIRMFMCTTHDRIADDLRSLPRQPGQVRRLPLLSVHAVRAQIRQRRHGARDDRSAAHVPAAGRRPGAMLKGGVSLASKDIEGSCSLLIDAEMKMFARPETPVIFLQNVVTDLLLGLGFNECFRIFHDHVRERYAAEPGFITMNVPRLLDVLEELGIDNPIICANINKIGFRMCGGLQPYETRSRIGEFRPLAMSVFASGAISPREAIDYVCE